MKQERINWKGNASPEKPGFVYFFCSTTAPDSGVTILFSDHFGADPKLVVGLDARLVGLWETENLLATERALAGMLGYSTRSGFEMRILNSLDWKAVNSQSNANNIAVRLVAGTISNLATELIATGVGIKPHESQAEMDSTVRDDLPLVADERQPNDDVWFDSEIESIVELAAKGELIYRLKCPETNSEKRLSRFKAIVFRGYQCFEMEKSSPGVGSEKIIDITEETIEGRITRFNIKTNAGKRLIYAKEAYVTRLSTL